MNATQIGLAPSYCKTRHNVHNVIFAVRWTCTYFFSIGRTRVKIVDACMVVLCIMWEELWAKHLPGASRAATLKCYISLCLVHKFIWLPRYAVQSTCAMYLLLWHVCKVNQLVTCAMAQGLPSVQTYTVYTRPNAFVMDFILSFAVQANHSTLNKIYYGLPFYLYGLQILFKCTETHRSWRSVEICTMEAINNQSCWLINTMWDICLRKLHQYRHSHIHICCFVKCLEEII